MKKKTFENNQNDFSYHNEMMIKKIKINKN